MLTTIRQRAKYPVTLAGGICPNGNTDEQNRTCYRRVTRIGRAIAIALSQAGAHVLVHYGRSATEAEAVVAAIRSNGGRADSLGADLATPDGPTLLAKQVRAIVGNRLDVLVANAGISKAPSFKITRWLTSTICSRQCARSILSGSATLAHPE